MNREKAIELLSHCECAFMDGGEDAAKLILYTEMRQLHPSRWDLFTFNFWNGYDYLFCFNNPRMIPMALPWFKLAILQFIHGPSKRIIINKRS